MNAPEIARPGLKWFNVAKPIPIASLRGRIVILDFWTEGCINCIQIIPTLRRIEERFPDQVVVIGVHSPKFANEKNVASVKDAISRYDIRHPIIHDPQMTLWRAYGVEAWPTLVVIGTDGNIVDVIAGEPDPDRFVAAIAKLVIQSAKAGELKPVALDLTPLPEPKGRYLFPGKLKPVPGHVKRWALADGGHNQIVLLDDHGQELARYGSGEAGLLDGAKDEARFDHPQGLIASNDAIFVADTENHAIRRIDLASGAVTTLAGTAKRGMELGAAEPARTTALASPWDLEKKGDQLFFANAGTHQIGVLDLERGTVAVLAGTGEEGLRDGRAVSAALAQPSGLALSADGKTLYLADSESSAVRAITLSDDPRIMTLVGAGLFEFGWVNGDFRKARLQHPLGIAVDGDAILVADTYNSAIRELELATHQVIDFDGGKFTCVDPVCIPTREPAGIVVDTPDRILLVDTGNQRIDEYRPSAKTYHTWSR
ncbi:MAG TPA: thioredoxin-like domain-containing protein [Candidatus Binataceae bacterium]|nr:thioredoxin-like domain-containing protein [Candidatus Binataceae bacterium]